MARGKPKSNLYMPKPTEWRWETLSDYDVRQRLQAARQTRDALQSQMDSIREERETAKAELWDRLPEAKLSEQQFKLAALEEMGKRLALVGKQLGQVDAAIDYIERRAGVAA